MATKKVLVPSKESINQSLKIASQSEEEIATDYLNLPTLPVNQKLKIDKIGIINFKCLTKQHLGHLTYGTFRKLNPELFFACQDPELDYEDDDQVSPAIIISGENKYRVDQVLWFPLSDIIVNILKKQGATGKKLLPIEVDIDSKNQWMVPLFNLAN